MSRRVGFLFYFCLVLIVSCTRHEPVYFFVPELKMVLAVEENRNTQDIYLCCQAEDVDRDNLEQHCTRIRYSGRNPNRADSSEECLIGVLRPESPIYSCILFEDETCGNISIFPKRCFVVKEDSMDSLPNDNYDIVSIRSPLNIGDSLHYLVRGKENSAFQISYETAVSFLNEYNPRPKGVLLGYIPGELPSYFRELKGNLSNSIAIHPTRSPVGFSYDGVCVECETLRDMDYLSFYIDPSIPEYLFNHHFYSREPAFHIKGNKVTVVITDMVIGCPGYNIDLYGNSVLVSER